MSQAFKKVLVANRGEIAMRIFRACHDLGLQTIAIYSNEDVYSLFRTAADESYLIGENESPLGAYLDIPRIIELAKKHGADAIHPGYGFLSENADFARACEAAGIKFIGPSSQVLDLMGDKLSAKQIAVACGVPTTPGTTEPLKSREAAQKLAMEFGFPVILKAAAGGGGRGMRRCDTVEEVGTNFDLVKAEAKKAFGNDDIFMEKFLVEPKHIEVQVLGDEEGNVVHLFERDCSLQRRYQKVVEFSPAFSVDKKIRQALYEDAVKIAKHVGYVNAGTLEFLVDREGHHYFIEMNPRIQVEHTVTEMVTGVDLVRSQILIAEGCPLSDPRIGIRKQSDLHLNGYAIQCRVTTEDPSNNFAPDTGKITSYRSPGGFGVRLDAATAGVGSEISPYYDSLLLKVTTWDNTFQGVCLKAGRAIREIHIRGVKTNIAFISNILQNPTFLAGGCHTKFIDETPELFELNEGQDRATKMLKYIGNIVVKERDGHKMYDPCRFPPVTGNRPDGLKQMLDAKGPKAVADWVLGQKKLLICDTTCRDAHQSLLATRVRTRDIVKGMEGTSEILADAFSLECWGGATFDACMRFLNEDPWERLRTIRQHVKHTKLQMLFRGQNILGYKHYADDVVDAFCRKSIENGIDIIRIFDALNDVRNLEQAIKSTRKYGGEVEATMSYTVSPIHNEDYFVKLAKTLEDMGASAICVKDMANLLLPMDAYSLIKRLKETVSIPIHLHTHNTTGTGDMVNLMAAMAGVDIVDTALSPLANGTSQPATESLVATLRGTVRDTGLDQSKLSEAAAHFRKVAARLQNEGILDPKVLRVDTNTLLYQVPGGMLSNLISQLKQAGKEDKYYDVLAEIPRVRKDFGYPPLVTPTSQIVGTQAVMNVIVGKYKTFPKESKGLLRGEYGALPGEVNPEVRALAGIDPEEVITCRPADNIAPELETYKEQFKDIAKSEEDVLSLALFPQVAPKFLAWRDGPHEAPAQPAEAPKAPPADPNAVRELFVEYKF